MNPPRFSRRGLLLAAAAAAGCGPKKATGYPGYCLVANQGSRSVAVVDLLNFRRLPAVPLDAAPSAILAHPNLPKALVLAPQAGTVFEMDASRLSLARRVHAGNEALAMKLAPSGGALWVLYRDPPALVEIALDTLRPRRRIRLPAAPDDFDLSADGRAAIVCRQARVIALASIGRSTIERTVPVSVEPTSVRFRLDGVQLLAASRADRSVTVVDVPTGETVVRLPLPVEPSHFCFNSDGGQLFVTGAGMDAVAVVYPYQTEVAETVLAGHAPDGMAVTDSYLLVANPESNTVTVLDIDTDFKLVASVQVGEVPREILITPDKQYALVLNEKSGDLAVIRIASLANRRYRPAPVFTMVLVGEKPVSAAVVTLT